MTNNTTNQEENKHYNWKQVEQEILESTDYKNYYASVQNNLNNCYSITMPPPNVTGSLHLGHALTTTLQDALARHHRLLGKNVLMQPGLDHAGIATQMVVERQLNAKGITKEDLGREEFIKKVYQWKEESGGTIINQIKRMGASADFSYLAFTMDNQTSNAVKHAFIQLYNQGLIYKASRLVNWDSKLNTAISDLEVVQKEVNSKMHYINYALQQGGFITIATTRPETIFADSAIAVNPTDERYSNLIGKTAYIPIINKPISIIADSYVDITKGSGALKVTPAHDVNDFEIGERHNLEKISILNFNGTLNNLVPKNYVGLTVKQAREKIVEDLTNINVLTKIEDITTSVPYGDRSDVVIEPMLTKQWFLDAKKLSIEAIKVVKDKEVKFYPENWENLYFDWMENIKPWCISRQLWWGHQIPVWYAPDGKHFVANNLQEAEQQALQHYGKQVTLVQDTDVLDTWFSSGLWPFVTLGWPNNSTKLQHFYPTNVLVTGFDIIFFWVARMVMLGCHFTKKVPFKHVYIHGLIRDEHGQKMSKSKGNVIDPLVMIEKFGTDALRFALFSYSGQGRDIILSENIIEGYRNFITKIFNAFKFANLNNFYYNANYNPNNLTLDVNKWIVEKVINLQNNITTLYQNYRFSDIGNAVYKTIWAEFCDWYIELSKPILYGNNQQHKQEVQETLGFVFNALLQIINPIAPFISQHLYNQLHKTTTPIKAYTHFSNTINLQNTKNIDLLIEFISKIRSLRTDFNIPYSTTLQIYVQNKTPSYMANNLDLIEKIVKISSITAVDTLQNNMLQQVVNTDVIGINLGSFINVNQETERLNKQKDKLQQELDKINTNLNNPKFLQNAGQQRINTFKASADEIMVKITKLNEIITKLV